MESAPQQRSVAQPSSSTRSPRFFPNSASTQRPLRLFTLSLEGSVILCPKSTKTATLTTFRINTCKSVSKQRTLTPFRMNTYEKTGGRGWGSLAACAPTRLRRGCLRRRLLATRHCSLVVIAAGEFADDVADEIFGVAE